MFCFQFRKEHNLLKSQYYDDIKQKAGELKTVFEKIDDYEVYLPSITHILTLL